MTERERMFLVGYDGKPVTADEIICKKIATYANDSGGSGGGGGGGAPRIYETTATYDEQAGDVLFTPIPAGLTMPDLVGAILAQTQEGATGYILISTVIPGKNDGILVVAGDQQLVYDPTTGALAINK